MGLQILYVGCESGDDELLKIVNKGETFESSLNALQKVKAAGIKSSVMILNVLYFVQEIGESTERFELVRRL